MKYTPGVQSLPVQCQVRTAQSVRDIERIAAFNASVHEDEGIGIFTRWKLDGTHPAVVFSDALFIEDSQSGEIVSSLCLIPQTWTYEGMPLCVGEVSLVGTHPDYRNHGLIRAQMDEIDHMLRARGCLLSCIEGIPYFYKQFGYEFAIPLGSCAQLGLDRVPPLAAGKTEPVTIRRMNVGTDLQPVMALHDAHAAELSVAAVRDEALWRYQESAPPGIPEPPDTYVVEDGTGIVGYFRVRKNMWGPLLEFAEAVVRPGGQAWGSQDVWLAVLRFGREQAKARDYTQLCFALPQSHPLLTTARYLGAETERQYAWQVRVVDCAAFLRHIAPALEKRLAHSLLADFTGQVDINTMRRVLRLQFARGRLVALVEAKQPQEQTTLRMPPLLLTQLLLGYRNYREIMDCSLDAWVHPNTCQLVDILFPKTESFVYSAT
jgi:GNAT superfamily N-acetyltransferase